jgi:uncharacterized protein (TIGR02466 family)
MKRTNIFTCPIWEWDNLPIDNSKLEHHAYTLMEKDPEFRNPEGYSGLILKWKSYNLTAKDFLAFPETGKLIALIEKLVVPCFDELNPRDSAAFVLQEVWFNIYPPLSSLESHPHVGNVLSGSYYIKAKPNCGDLAFLTGDNSTYYNFAAKYFHNRNDVTAVKHLVKPVENSMVVAPSHIMHAVKENRSEEDRISLSFNYKVISNNTHTPNDKYF